MFKPFKGCCSACGKDRWIVVKKGLCDACNEKKKRSSRISSAVKHLPNTKKGLPTITALKKVIEKIQGKRKGVIREAPFLEKELDRVFSRYIRLSYADSNGVAECVTCPARLPIELMDAGHYIPRANHSLRWDVKNCHPQCKHCNQTLCGNIKKYKEYLVRTYGSPVLEYLNAKKNETMPMSRVEMYARIEALKKKIKELSR